MVCDNVANYHTTKISIRSLNCLGSGAQQLRRLAAFQF